MSQESVSSETSDSELLAESKVDPSRATKYYKTVFIDSQEMASTSSAALWTVKEKRCLQEHKTYFRQMIDIVTTAEAEGPQKLPKPPKRKLQDLFADKLGKKKKEDKMTPTEFHNYLQKHIQDMTKSYFEKGFQV
ncbi:hypothetical protein PoB_004650500 [Plakobranchus ocellatus]|uniref:Uncharacterized protein n=1 Tax=Plakobranchus ocellatus TaxID=259542 RepID=A0AAV4BKJ0_9GAST|nr:hypothetical protein PoB_004650500 [Plakobranchus ocellatus]